MNKLIKKLEENANNMSFSGKMTNVITSLLNRLSPDNTVFQVFSYEHADGTFELRIVQQQFPDNREVVEWDEMVEVMDKTITFKSR